MKLKRFYFKRVKSTNDVALKYITRGIEKGIILTEVQTKGKAKEERIGYH